MVIGKAPSMGADGHRPALRLPVAAHRRPGSRYATLHGAFVDRAWKVAHRRSVSIDASRIAHRASRIEHRASSIAHRASRDLGEFATRLSGAPLIVVLGHGECGAIKGAIDGARLGYVTAMLRNFAPAIKAACAPGEATVKNAAYVQAVADANAKIAATQLTAKSEVLRMLVEQKKLRVVSAMHDIATGNVRYLV